MVFFFSSWKGVMENWGGGRRRGRFVDGLSLWDRFDGCMAGKEG